MVAAAAPGSSDSDEVERAADADASLGAQPGTEAISACASKRGVGAKLVVGLGLCLVGQGGFEPPTT